MKALLVLHDIIEPYDGVSTVAYNTVRGLKKCHDLLEKKDVNIHVLSISRNPIKKMESMPFLHFSHTKRRRPTALTGEFQALVDSLSVGRVDLVHSHDLLEIFPYSYNKRLKTILTIHSVLWNELGFMTNPYIRYYYYSSIKKLRRYSRRLTNLTVNSEYVKDEFIKAGLNPGKIIILDNPVSEEFFNTIKTESDFILYPTQITYLKNQMDFLKALAILGREGLKPRVVFAGDRHDYYYRELLSYTDRHDLNVEFKDRIPYQQMPGMFAKALMVALLSKQETQSMVLLEAAASGTPALASDIPSNRYVVSDGETGFVVNSTDSKAVAERIRTLLDDANLRRKMGVCAKELAEKRCKDVVVARKIIDLYHETVSTR